MKILIIESDKRITQYLALALEKEENFQVTECHCGAKGLKLAQNEKFDILLLEIALPKVDGFSIIGKLREIGSDLPIIVLSTQLSLEEKVSVLRLGADDYICKPFHIEEVKARIYNLIRRCCNSDRNIQVDDLVLNTVTHIAYKNNIPIELSQKEYLLLYYFMRNVNKILTRQDIQNNIDKEPFDIKSNLIDVYVKRLRNKIQSSKNRPDYPYIKSIRGIGYKMITKF